MTINSFKDFIIYSPIKSIYFLLSPLPWDWRGLNDIAAFLLDSSAYLYTGIITVKSWGKVQRHKELTVLLLIMIVVTSITYGVGVGNAGTAMRHRQKLSPLFFILLSLLLDERKIECSV